MAPVLTLTTEPDGCPGSYSWIINLPKLPKGCHEHQHHDCGLKALLREMGISRGDTVSVFANEVFTGVICKITNDFLTLQELGLETIVNILACHIAAIRILPGGGS